VRAHYTERPKQELVRLDSFEILWSPLLAPVDALRLAGMQLVVEVLEEAMPEGALEDNVFRLAMTCLTAMETQVWAPVTYFSVWMNRLMGWWPELGHCAACGLDLKGGEDVWWSPVADGVTCRDDRRPQSRLLTAESVAESAALTRTGLGAVMEQTWTEERARDLRAFAVGMLERHLERRLRSAAGLG
jgi:DNA repair protein RecO (recombination protein O)